MFQSPRSGKFVSNSKLNEIEKMISQEFQSPRSGNFVSNLNISDVSYYDMAFQSPRSGKFVSNKVM